MKLIQLMNEGEEKRPLSNEVKKHFLEIVSTYNKYQEMMDRKSDLSQVAETLGGITEAARTLAIHEGDDWFDKQTIKRNMSELDKLGKEFDKCAVEANALDQRLHGLYEDMGHILSRYYKIGEITEEQMKERLGMNESHSNCGCGCGGKTVGGCSTSVNESVNEEEMIKLGEEVEKIMEENVPTDPGKWSYYKAQAKKKFDVYPSAYANGWAAKKYKEAGGGWKKGKSESVNEGVWTAEQERAVALLDSQFRKYLSAKGIEPTSIEASRAWKSYGFQDKMRKIFPKSKYESVNEAKFGYKDSTASYIKKHNNEYKIAEKMNKGNEQKFYDDLQAMEDKLGHSKTMLFISNALRGYGVDMFKDPKIKNPADAQEALFLLSK
jgi:hypothetical protein